MKQKIYIILAALGFFTLYPAYYLISNYRNSNALPEDKMYFCTAADERFYQHTLNLIGSIHRLHFNDTQEIAVFDLGFTPDQRKHIDSIANVRVYDVEKTHPDLLKPLESRPGKIARGLYAWKPVCIKQALDSYPFVLWMDAGTTVINSLQPIFECIKEQGAFLTECGHSIRAMATQKVVHEFNLNTPERAWILDESTQGVSGGLIGVSRKYHKNFVHPLYTLSYNLELFEDDGTAGGGPGWGRQDQPLISVLACLLKMPIYKKDFNMEKDNRDYIYEYITVSGKDTRLHITEIPRQVHNETTIFCSRNFMPWLEGFKKSIQFKKGYNATIA